MNEGVETANLISQLPLTVLLLLLLWAIHKGWIVTAARHTEQNEAHEKLLEEKEDRFIEMSNDRSYWRSVALRALGVAEQATKDV